jgi:hypothetical protein
MIADDAGPPTSRSRGLWLVPLALLVHNLEEALTIGAALPRLQDRWTRWAGRPVALPSDVQFQRALVVLTVAVGALYLLAWTSDRFAYALVVVQAVMALNIASHVASAVLLGGYAPGLVTALLVEAPVSALVYRRLRGGWMTPAQWRLLLPLALLLHGPALAGLLLWARGG